MLYSEMFYSENKDHLEFLLGVIGDPITDGNTRVRVCERVMCMFRASLVQEVINERKPDWRGNVGNGCHIMARILQTF